MQGPLSFAEHYRARYVPQILAQRIAGETGSDMFRFRHPVGRFTHPPVREFVLWVLSSAVKSEFDCGAGRWRGTVLPGSFIVAPPFTDVNYTAHVSGSGLVLSLPARTFARCQEDPADNDTGDLGAVHAAPASNATVRVLVEEIWREVRSPQRSSALFVDSALVAIAARLRTLGTRTNVEPRATGALSGPRLRLALDYLESHLSEDVSLTALAAAVGLSEGHVCKAFRLATGEPPHRWLVKRRIAKAKALLSTTTRSITEVALDVGFGSSSHFAAAFRRWQGVSPRTFRRNV